MDLSKNNSLLTEKAINHIPRSKKRKKVPVCNILGSSFIMDSENRQVDDSYII